MSPAFERRLARIDKAFDRIRHARAAEEGRRGLAEFYFKCAIIDCVMREHGPEAVAWVLGVPGARFVPHDDGKKKDAEDAEKFAEDAESDPAAKPQQITMRR